MAKIVENETSIVNYNELQSMITTYITGWRKKKRPKIAKSLTCCGMTFIWSDIHNKYYDPAKPENKTDSRMTVILKEKGYNPKILTYELIW